MSEKNFEYNEIQSNLLEYDENIDDDLINQFINKKQRYYDENKKKILEGMKILKLNRKNVKMIESILMIDSAYAYDNFSEDIKKLAKKDGYTYENMRKLCKDINNANSTHIDSDNKGSTVIPYRIMKICHNYDDLKNALSGNKKTKKLFDALYLPIEEEEYNNVVKEKKLGIEKDSNKSYGRKNHNISFASKFFSYLANKVLDDTSKDKFPKYDNIVSKAIPMYLNYFLADPQVNDKVENEISKIKNRCNNGDRFLLKSRDGKYTKIEFGRYDEKGESCKIYKEYEQYKKIIDLVIDIAKEKYNKNCEKMTRAGLDHLLWYGYKGRLK